MYGLARKNNLSRNLQKMQKKFKLDYNFYPKTYSLPLDYNELIQKYGKPECKKTFIVKPEAMCQGKGIYLS